MPDRIVRVGIHPCFLRFCRTLGQSHRTYRGGAVTQAPVSGAFETFAQHAIPLWNDSVGVGSRLWQDTGGGSFPGTEAGLNVIGSGGDLFALWFIASAYCAKNDQDPTAYTICQANIDCDVSSMWVEETSMT